MMNSPQYKLFVDHDSGRILVTYVLNDERVTLSDSSNIVDITDHPRRKEIMNNPELFRVVKNGNNHDFLPNDKPINLPKPLKIINK